MEDLWRIRKRKRMSVSELSSKSGVPARRIYQYESGERPITSGDLTRLAKALYVEEWEIKLQSDPAPKPKEAKPQVKPSRKPRAAEAPPKKQPAKRKRPPPGPARESQIAHMRQLAAKLGLDDDALEEQAGKPLAELTRPEASSLLGNLQKQIQEAPPDELGGKRKRPYLPESVDAFELHYLTDCQKQGDVLTFRLFDGEEVQGQIVGFSPYAITIRTPHDDELTLRKLAIAYYQRPMGAKGEGS